MHQNIAKMLFLLCLISSFTRAEEEALKKNAPEESSADKEVIDNPEYYLPNIPLKRAKSILKHMSLFNREDEVVTLKTPNESFYGLFLAESSDQPQGGVLLLHDNQQHGHWPDVVAPIREYLPQFGWSTLSIELPDAPAKKRIKREELAASNTDTVNNNENTAQEPEGKQPPKDDLEKPESEKMAQEGVADNSGIAGSTKTVIEADNIEDAEPGLPRLQSLPAITENKTTAEQPKSAPEPNKEMMYLKQNRNRILTAIEYLKSRGQFNIVIIGYGIGAAWAIDYAQQVDTGEKAQKGLTLITIDALASRLAPGKMQQQLKNLQIPYLDLIHPKPGDSLTMARKRLSIMKRAKNNRYQQIITANMASYHDSESPTSRRIRGWLMKNAGGTLVKVKP
jgi:hypothetical protein